MSLFKVKGRELKKATSFLAPAVGTKASAQQESSLLYVKVLDNDQLLLQVQGTTLISSITIDSEENIDSMDTEILLDFNTIDKYVKNNSVNDDFIFDLDELEESEIVTIKVGTRFVGTLATVPLDAYEVQSFDDSSEVAEISSSVLDDMITMSCQFANMKQDTQDYMQIVAENNELTFFTTDGEIISKFQANLDSEDEFDITVRASALKKIRSFSSDLLSLRLSEDEYFLLLKEDSQIRAIVLHSDPPYTYQEVNELEDKAESTINIPSESMLSALSNIECSSSDQMFNLFIKNDNEIKLSSEDLNNSKTEVDIDMSVQNYSEILSGDTYKTSIPLFRKLGVLGKDSGRLTLDLFTATDDGGDNFIDVVDAVGSIGDISYTISFGLMEK
tara:strand:- start:56 stop:1222 length:1167 start_codon:yes stop_codon:yes gene_type:complete